MRGVVTCPQPRAAEVGARVLEHGGSAFDAVIAAAFVQMVVDPFMCGIGGLGTALLYVAKSGQVEAMDFYTTAGSKVRPDMWATASRGTTEISHFSLFDDFRSELGYTSIMTPGAVAGFEELHRRYATLPLAELLAPAISTARDGFRVTGNLANWLRQRPQPGMPDSLSRIRATEACAAIYLKDDQPYAEGETLRNPDLARTLERIIAEGPASFYRGALADEIARDVEANGSFVTGADLAGYKLHQVEPISTTYRGFTVMTNPPPGNGPWITEMLNILEGFDLGAMEHDGPDHLHVLASAMRLAHVDRERYLGDPRYVDVPLERVFLAKEHAAALRDQLRAGTPQSAPAAGEIGTTHVTATDAAGNIACITHTLGAGSGVVTPGLGFIYNNSMRQFDPEPGRANSMAPGKARITAMCPTIVLKDGRPVLAAGAPGGDAIMSAVLQAISNVLDFGMTAVEAVSAPRIHCQGPLVYAEGRVREDTVRELGRLGHQVEHRPMSYERDFARAQVVRVLRDGHDGGSDPRGDGGGVQYARG